MCWSRKIIQLDDKDNFMYSTQNEAKSVVA